MPLVTISSALQAPFWTVIYADSGNVLSSSWKWTLQSTLVFKSDMQKCCCVDWLIAVTHTVTDDVIGRSSVPAEVERSGRSQQLWHIRRRAATHLVVRKMRQGVCRLLTGSNHSPCSAHLCS